jgi:hypothetical protein
MTEWYGPFFIHTLGTATGADQGASAGDQPIDSIEVVHMALLCGFRIQLQCPGTRWNIGFGARTISVQYAELGSVEQPRKVEIYQVDNGQNITLSRTVLGLKAATDYAVRWMMLDDAGALLYISASQVVHTLSAPARFGS